MKGYIKCDICGRFYAETENERYDGLAVFYYRPANGGRNVLAQDENIIESDGSNSHIPASMDMCADCFKRFINWAKMCKADAQCDLK